MIRIGFLRHYSEEWVGGVNYIKNLLCALHSLHDQTIQPIVFVSKETKPWIRESFSPYARIVETSLLDRNSLNWRIWQKTKQIFDSDIWVSIVLFKYKVNVFSHSNLYRTFFTKTLNWIPDFQHLYLPDLFTPNEIENRNYSFAKIAQKSDLVILSSNDAFADFKAFSPEFYNKGRILRFVAQPEQKLINNDQNLENKILEKYGLIRTEFFYLPNQFWQHKNHKVAFEALALLKQKNKNLTLVCSGKMSDYRNQNHIQSLKEFIKANDLDIRLLGMIEYDDVIVLMKKSIAVINPSLFEGWSSTVEECKVIGKSLILSEIPVHREQNPANSVYFDPNNAVELAAILELFLTQKRTPPSPINLEQETENFALNYMAIVKSLI